MSTATFRPAKAHSPRPLVLTPILAVTALLFCLCFVSVGALAKAKLVVYTYDSFASWGPAKQIEEAFEKKYDVDLLFVAPASSGESLARLMAELETGGTDADLFVGLSDTSLPKTLDTQVFRLLDYSKIPNLKSVPTHLLFDETKHVIPFDYGFVTLVYDVKALPESDRPKSLEDLTLPKYAKKIIAIDPRTSSVGQAFLAWTIQEYGEKGYLDYWKRLKPNLLTVAGGWSAAYSMFKKGEAPIVVSYSTDTAYAVFSGKGPKYGVLTLGGKAYRQIEGAGIVRTSKNIDLAYAFLDYLLSPEAQSLIPTTQWMFPANAKAALPDVFTQYAVTPQQAVWLNPALIEKNSAKWLRDWSTLIME